MVEIQKGDKVKDRVTGMVGTVDCISDWRSGLKQYGVEPIELKDGAIQANCWIDADRVMPFPDTP